MSAGIGKFGGVKLRDSYPAQKTIRTRGIVEANIVTEIRIPIGKIGDTTHQDFTDLISKAVASSRFLTAAEAAEAAQRAEKTPDAEVLPEDVDQLTMEELNRHFGYVDDVGMGGPRAGATRINTPAPQQRIPGGRVGKQVG